MSVQRMVAILRSALLLSCLAFPAKMDPDTKLRPFVRPAFLKYRPARGHYSERLWFTMLSQWERLRLWNQPLELFAVIFCRDIYLDGLISFGTDFYKS